MKKTYLLILLVALTAVKGYCQSWSLVWNDEFDSTAVNEKKWGFDIGTGCSINLCGWGNNEKQYYRKENVTVADGILTITSKKQTFQSSNYTSGRINSSGKASWKYGKMEARIKMAKGQGLWHAFWMLPQDLVYGGWPKSGEIDIMEYFGHYPGLVQSTLHYGDPWPENKYIYKQYFSDDFSLDFHNYTVIWEENSIKFYVDDNFLVEYTPKSLAPKPWPFDQRFYFIINTAVGGNLTNNNISDAVLPGSLQVDYVRVYQKRTEFDSAKVAGPTTVCTKDETVLFTTSKKKNWSFNWSVPEGADIISGQGTDSLKVNFKNAITGSLVVTITNDSSKTKADKKLNLMVSSCDSDIRPYGSMAVIPGKIEAERFDNGGNGKSYYDTESANQGKEYRNEGVDIQATTDGGGSFNIGWTEAGEWLNYTVKVSKKANYDFIVRSASTVDNNTITIYFDDADVTGNLVIKNTNDWQVFADNTKKGVALDSGVHVMKLKINKAGVNVNYINVVESISTGINSAFNDNDLMIYPNPASNALFVKLKNNTDTEASISNIVGTEILKKTDYISGAAIDISLLPAGIYFINIKSNSEVVTKKFIKN